MAELRKDRYIGIDLGTTNTVMATLSFGTDDKPHIEIEKFRQKKNNRTSPFDHLPSTIYINDASKNDFLVGYEAKEKINQMSASGGGDYVINSKMRMGTNTILYETKDFELKAIDVATMILERCGKAFNRTYSSYTQYDYTNLPTVVTVPARFESVAKKDTKLAAINAGFNESGLNLLPEPTAALLSYIWSQREIRKESRAIDISETKRFLVVDLGGGTCDVVVIDVIETNEDEKDVMFFTTVGTPDRVDLGGANFDSKFAEHILNKFFKDNNIDSSQISSEEKYALIAKIVMQAEDKKIEFSENLMAYIEEEGINENDIVEGRVNFDDIIDKIDSTDISILDFYEGKRLYCEFTLKEYLDSINTLLLKSNERTYTVEDTINKNKNLENAILNTLEICDAKLDSIDYVLFTGGMAKFLPLKKRIFDIVGKRVLCPNDPMTAVASGAALFSLFKDAQENNTYGDNKGLIGINEDAKKYKTTLKLKGVLDAAYLIDVKDQLPVVLVEKNVPYPQEPKMVDMEFKVNSMTNVLINIYKGQNQYDYELEKLAPLRCNFKKSKKIGSPFNIQYELDDDGIIKIKAIFPDGEEFSW